MKKWLAFVLALALVLSCSACAEPTEEPLAAADGMLSFYYRQATLQYDTLTGVVSSELRSISDTEPIESWLPVYLRGPVSSELTSPFPRGVQVIGTEVVGLCPMKALVDCAEYYLQIEDFDFDAQVLENYIL